ncbi:uncharacterized protein LOC123315397 [Coccinella septempunctata]|uniref:uncharacterized protein LOC123315397 n=1 Tax=Coccinella septempunctata TaxID=41139 RepID=UPI001D070BCD|nr:uncharacterized protein LOC123315397 [Coccinella septempunctata]
MNKIKSISEVQQLGKKESRNILQEYVGTKLRKRRCSRSSYGAGINFLINVSSSGTNLNKKIQDEISKLEYVEKKIRNHKTNAKIICSSAKVPNKVPYERKLKHMLANMLDNIDSVGIKSKKIPKSIQKIGEVETDISTVRKREKVEKSLQQCIKVDSFTNVEDKQKNKTEKKRDKIKKPISFRKSSLKKPAFEPSLKCNAFGTGFEFAESLNFVPKVDFHLSSSEMEKIVVPPKKDVANVLKLVAEKSSGSYVNCIYDSTSYNEVNFDYGLSKNKMNKRCSGTVFVQESECALKDGSVVEDKMKTRGNKPERKRFYSYLRRGNFTISHHTDESREHHLEKNSNINLQYITEEEQDDENAKETVILNHHLENGTGVVGDDQTSVYPIDLIERSILAVENILRTINSITKDFSERKANKNIISKTPEHLLKITESSSERDRQQEVERKKHIESSFEELKEIMFSHYGKGQFEKEVANDNNLEENMDPLKKAINSLKNENISKRPTIPQASKLNVEQSCSFSSSFSCVNFTASQKLYNSSVLNQILLDNNFSSNTKVTGNKFSCYSSDLSKCSNLFPEYNFQKCLSLLRKKFRDFDKVRQKGLIDKSALESSFQPETNCAKKFEKNETVDEITSMVYGQTNKKEHYQVCFKNENFKNQSETSIESCYRMNIEKFNLNINPIQGMVKSSPVISK